MRKQARSQNKNLSVHLKKLGKEGQIKLKTSSWKEIEQKLIMQKNFKTVGKKSMKSKDGSIKGTIKLKALGRVIQEKREDTINYRYQE